MRQLFLGTVAPHPALQAALPAASGSRFAGASHGTRIPRSTLLPKEKVRSGRGTNQEPPRLCDYG